MQLTTQPIEEHTITVLLPRTYEENAQHSEHVKAEIARLVRGAQRRHGQPLTYCLDEFIELGDEQDLHIYQLQMGSASGHRLTYEELTA